ncbi:NAD-dependent succinate-semialdehyde dehydrogenase [Oceanibacterium hippocampi]|uniref:Succinate-semialdehyde dehydrogenase [NADP(+)] GabD n=1 Tax=Oceanibacterium hippocampi TaxID=745714 RepID=A0A1Y5TEA5_9PROT|nr:NAD-dependent succinate-semialdehyde dehydrogenase [Oceanibacterium hippocampi]SLN62317.1 Succinate-semialdehyde dehydrogenase [NADP(+)] GabD [Oceanibacterium hippocampi]
MSALFPIKQAVHETAAELDRLGNRRLLRTLAYVDGRWTAGPEGRDFTVDDPATGLTIARVAKLGAGDTRAAIDAATTAFAGWSKAPAAERAARLDAWHRLIVANREDLAVLMTLEQGKPLAEARGEIDYAASFVAFYATEANRSFSEPMESHLPGAEVAVERIPLGVAGIVTPWNFPAAMLTRKAAAALAAGCTVVAHPSAWTPLSALALAALADEAGLPAGVFNVVTGEASEIVGTMVDDRRVRVFSFTGSTEIGTMLAGRCAGTMKTVIMELGGHAPLVIFDDADIERAVGIAMAAKFATSGQDCLAANRILVQRGIYEAFTAAFAEKVSALRTGNGFDDVDIGPLMHEGAVDKAARHVDDAVARGARLLVGGARHEAGPLFYQPTLLADVPADALIMTEETFAPVAALAPFDTEAEAIGRANDTDYGLVAYLVTADPARIERMSAALDFGMVAVNRVKITGAPVPFGGVRMSGLGREGSRHGLEAFTTLKYRCLEQA